MVPLSCGWMASSRLRTAKRLTREPDQQPGCHSGRQFGQRVLNRSDIEFKIGHALNCTEARQSGGLRGGEQQLLLFVFKPLHERRQSFSHVCAPRQIWLYVTIAQFVYRDRWLVEAHILQRSHSRSATNLLLSADSDLLCLELFPPDERSASIFEHNEDPARPDGKVFRAVVAWSEPRCAILRESSPTI
jgi:hypothetical protein